MTEARSVAPARTEQEHGSEIEIRPVADKADLERFIRLPWAIYADDANWVPPLLIERRDYLNPKKNPYFQHAEVRLFLALRDGRPVGRISAQVNQAHLEHHGDATGHFGFLEAEDDGAVFAALTGAAEDWLQDKGMRRVVGPFSFSINDESGLLVDGFDQPPMILMGHARRYYGPRLEGLGYVKARDLLAYDFAMDGRPLTRSAQAISKRLARDPTVTIRDLRRAELADEVEIVLDIFNDAWSDNWGFVPLTDAEIAHLAKEMKPLLRGYSLCIAEMNGEPVAFGVALPNLHEAIADLNGRLLPFGVVKLLYRLLTRRIKSARLPLMGVRKAYHGTPLGVAMAFCVIERLHRQHLRRGFTRAELSWILEDNLAMRNIIESGEARPYKTYRVYEKALV